MAAGPRRHGESFKAYRKRLANEERLMKRFLRGGRMLYRSTRTSTDGKTLMSTGPARRRGFNDDGSARYVSAGKVMPR